MKWLKRLFTIQPETWPVVRDVVAAVTPPAPPVPLTEDQIQKLLDFVIDQFHYFKMLGVYKWQSIPKVVVTTTFCGWGYVEGRDRGIVVNKRLAMTEADDDMDFTEFCILIDGVPTMLLYHGRRGTLLLQIINADAQGSMANMLGAGWIDIHTFPKFNYLTLSVQKPLLDLFQHLFTMSGRVHDPIEKVLSYSETA